MNAGFSFLKSSWSLDGDHNQPPPPPAAASAATFAAVSLAAVSQALGVAPCRRGAARPGVPVRVARRGIVSWSLRAQAEAIAAEHAKYERLTDAFLASLANDTASESEILQQYSKVIGQSLQRHRSPAAPGPASPPPASAPSSTTRAPRWEQLNALSPDVLDLSEAERSLLRTPIVQLPAAMAQLSVNGRVLLLRKIVSACSRQPYAVPAPVLAQLTLVAKRHVDQQDLQAGRTLLLDLYAATRRCVGEADADASPHVAAALGHVLSLAIRGRHGHRHGPSTEERGSSPPASLPDDPSASASADASAKALLSMQHEAFKPMIQHAVRMNVTQWSNSALRDLFAWVNPATFPHWVLALAAEMRWRGLARPGDVVDLKSLCARARIGEWDVVLAQWSSVIALAERAVAKAHGDAAHDLAQGNAAYAHAHDAALRSFVACMRVVMCQADRADLLAYLLPLAPAYMKGHDRVQVLRFLAARTTIPMAQLQAWADVFCAPLPRHLAWPSSSSSSSSSSMPSFAMLAHVIDLIHRRALSKGYVPRHDGDVVAAPAAPTAADAADAADASRHAAHESAGFLDLSYSLAQTLVAKLAQLPAAERNPHVVMHRIFPVLMNLVFHPRWLTLPAGHATPPFDLCRARRVADDAARLLGDLQAAHPAMAPLCDARRARLAARRCMALALLPDPVAALQADMLRHSSALVAPAYDSALCQAAHVLNVLGKHEALAAWIAGIHASDADEAPSRYPQLLASFGGRRGAVRPDRPTSVASLAAHQSVTTQAALAAWARGQGLLPLSDWARPPASLEPRVAMAN
ncbi:hypothetical protein CXG81DRAFT_24089 [Caulochytrium protostelioides]|uniref:Uncharacterized protein n=1 Tax=Caulochytrium protostelioides TaxID=1555241 RepID=A0A4P9XCW8_9FUNG|nr:hypothetical protein CXG81DRAFT_24089 [Caulochytrium protostelioides]|eukprot:RKP03314.1 hypothetical protein CXG81DRAFT_24089 [Caulochytrium protostelioides]